MSALATLQQAMLEALWAPSPAEGVRALAPHLHDGTAVERGLRAYRTNGRELAVRALAAVYPAVAHRLGEDDFAGLARRLWLHDPPVRGDVAQWGEGLAASIESLPELVADQPALADLARAEWLLHRCAVAEDAPQDAGSLALLEHAPERLRLRLAPGTTLLASRWPVVALLGEAHDEQAAQTAVVWREGLRPRVREAMQGEAPFLAASLGGSPLAEALDAAPELDFNAWLAQAWHSKLLLGAALA